MLFLLNEAQSVQQRRDTKLHLLIKQFSPHIPISNWYTSKSTLSLEWRDSQSSMATESGQLFVFIRGLVDDSGDELSLCQDFCKQRELPHNWCTRLNDTTKTLDQNLDGKPQGRPDNHKCNT